MELFREVPGYNWWQVSKRGDVYESETGRKVKTFMYGTRKFCSYRENGVSRLVSVHRLVALAWVPNDNPRLKTVVNHIDGDPLNNWYENLEWVTTSENNYHAVNSGLRTDSKPCRIRDFYSKEVKEFPSIAQASEYMGLPKTAFITKLRPKLFGKLINGTYEFRLKDDPEPFFYEDKPYIIEPSRFMVIVENENGTKRYLFKARDLLQDYQLYGCPEGKSIPALVEFARKKFPNKKFILRDGVAEGNAREKAASANFKSKPMPITARKGSEMIEFETLSEAARYFNVDRDVIKLRLTNPESTYLGWSFRVKPSYMET